MDEIVNRVKNSGLITLDLADFKPDKEFVEIDLANLLWKGLVLKEKEFRDWIKKHDWTFYEDKAVFIHCSTDAIVPTWAYMLIASSLNIFTSNFVFGKELDLERMLILEKIHRMPLEDFKDKRVIIKGCSTLSFPELAMTELIKVLQPLVKSIMYGEPCSTVPIFKSIS